jgi:hypothetical protein
MTFNVLAGTPAKREHDWQTRWEAFAVCQACRRSTTLLLVQKKPEDTPFGLNNRFRSEGYVTAADLKATQPPDSLPENIRRAFTEGAKSVVTGSPNAAGAMFRLCIDLATKPLLPPAPFPGLKRKTRRDLAPRLDWLFDNARLPADLRDLSACIREDGNDGAHDGTLGKEEALDLQDFTALLLERLYTLPARVKSAQKRREDRRGASEPGEPEQKP